MKDDLLRLAGKIDWLARTARVQDLALLLEKPESDRVGRIAKVLHQLGDGVYLIGSGPYTQGVYSVMAEEVVFGRLATPLEQPLDKGVDIFCQDVASLTPREVSRYHAMIYRMGDIYQTYHLRDLGSTCGTYLNGKRVEAGESSDGPELAQGDVISLGPSQINTYVFVAL